MGLEVLSDLGVLRASVQSWSQRHTVDACLDRLSEHLGIVEKISGFASWVGDGWTEVSAMAHRRKMARLRGPQNQEQAGEGLCM